MTNNPTKYESYPASGYRGEAVTRTGLTDGRTDGRTDGQTDGRTGQKHYTPRNFVAWGIIIHIHVLSSMENKYAKFGEIWMKNKKLIDFLKYGILLS